MRIRILVLIDESKVSEDRLQIWIMQGRRRMTLMSLLALHTLYLWLVKSNIKRNLARVGAKSLLMMTLKFGLLSEFEGAALIIITVVTLLFYRFHFE